MASKLAIWNMALGFIGTRTVASETEHTVEAVQCRLFWDSARLTALRAYPWNFAQSRERLAAVTVPEVWSADWPCAYAVPAQCLRLHRVFQEGDGRHGGGHWMMVNGGDRELILTDVSQALADFTRDVAETSRWDDTFCAVMARRLACLICVPLLKNSSGRLQELEALYRAALPDAVRDDATERSEAAAPDTWLTARGGNQSGRYDV